MARHTGHVTVRRQAGEPAPSARRSPGRPPVPLDRIVATALQIVDEEGAEALSMRSLAQRLDSGTATLYRHFSGRADLIAQVIDRVLGEAQLSAEELAAMSWQQACQLVARRMFEALGRHGNVAPLLAGQVALGPNAMAMRERCIAVLLDNGLPPRLAARAYATLARYVLGFAIQLSARDGPGRPDEALRSGVFRACDPSMFPATVAAAEFMPVPLEDEFAFGLDLLVEGLGRQLEAAGQTGQ
jgi:TetR/AcrR family transcriptional regulator, tetracycline repressor protein